MRKRRNPVIIFLNNTLHDDSHSHLSIYPPKRWLALFADVAPGYRRLSSEPRKVNPANLVITIGIIVSARGASSAEGDGRARAL